MVSSEAMMQVQMCGFLWTHKIEKAFSFWELCPSDPHHAVFGQFVCYFIVTMINVYWSMDAAII